MQPHPSIFREYDVRGITEADHSPELVAEYEKWYGEFPGVTLPVSVCRLLGQAYGTTIKRAKGSRIIIGHEIRPYSQEIKQAFIDGVLSTGINVIDAGPSTTPMLYFANANLKLDGAVSVTGSHNVYFFNGFKLMKKDNYPVYGEELQSWQDLIKSQDFVEAHPGRLTKQEIYPLYQDYLVKAFPLARPLRVVVDCGNGTPGLFLPQLFSAMGCQVTKLYCEPDATFPNHLPDPEDSYVLQDLSDKVGELGADLGLAFDADGDRFGCVDQNGAYVSADHLIALFAKNILSHHPGKKILYDVKCSRHLDLLIKQAGGTPIMHRTGHAPIKQSLREDQDLVFAGEISGHLYFTDPYYRIDDGAFAACYTLSLLADSPGPLSTLFEFFPASVATPELKLPCLDSTKHLVVQALIDKFAKDYPVITIDGARINFTSTSWALVRASNTAPTLSIRLEADTVDELLRIKNLLADLLEQHPTVLDRVDRSTVTSRSGKLGWI